MQKSGKLTVLWDIAYAYCMHRLEPSCRGPNGAGALARNVRLLSQCSGSIADLPIFLGMIGGKRPIFMSDESARHSKELVSKLRPLADTTYFHVI